MRNNGSTPKRIEALRRGEVESLSLLFLLSKEGGQKINPVPVAVDGTGDYRLL
jgi:hypothetical protein